MTRWISSRRFDAESHFELATLLAMDEFSVLRPAAIDAGLGVLLANMIEA